MTNREIQLVELVTEAGVPVGQSTVEDAHREPGQLHRAFSVVLVDADGRLLLQRRAAVKTRFPLRWANACCGHPLPGIPVVTAATVRLHEELGISGVALTEMGVHAYRAKDEHTGLVEYEHDHVLLGRVTADVVTDPDPAEVAELQWAPMASIREALTTDPDSYAPWLPGVIEKLPVDLD